jgi:hypothetical protein
VDEARQGLAPNRTPSVRDVGIDTVGAMLAMVGIAGLGPATRPVVWGGQGGVLTFAVLTLAVAGWDVTLGLPAWDLGLAALAAGIAGWGLGAVDRVSSSGGAVAASDANPSGPLVSSRPARPAEEQPTR